MDIPRVENVVQSALVAAGRTRLLPLGWRRHGAALERSREGNACLTGGEEEWRLPEDNNREGVKKGKANEQMTRE
eukprot:2731576-Pyramimonas_sp.AAC.1